MSVFQKAAFAVPVSEIAVKNAFPGFSFDVFRDPPGQAWAGFVHKTDEFVVVAEGRVTIDVDEEHALCEAGDLVRIPTGSVHTLSTSADAGSVWFYGYGVFDG
ncbi:MAG: cupin domain-containing protein [Pseudomonadota bacterium]